MPRCRYGCDFAGPLADVEAHEAALHGARIRPKQPRTMPAIAICPPQEEIAKYEFERAARLARKAGGGTARIRQAQRKRGR